MALDKVKMGLRTLTCPREDLCRISCFSSIMLPALLISFFWQCFPLILSPQNHAKSTLSSTAGQVKCTQYVNFKQSRYYSWNYSRVESCCVSVLLENRLGWAPCNIIQNTLYMKSERISAIFFSQSKTSDILSYCHSTNYQWK